MTTSVDRQESLLGRIRTDHDDDDEATIWSISSYGGVSRSSQDDDLIFECKQMFNCVFSSLYSIDLTSSSSSIYRQ
jgi:hypothetical protein